MNKDAVKGMIEILEHIRKRPCMYLIPCSPEGMRTFLEGSRIGAIQFSGYDREAFHNLSQEAAKERGWNTTVCNGIFFALRQKLADEAAILEELITIEIAVWRKILSQIEQYDKTDTPATD